MNCGEDQEYEKMSDSEEASEPAQEEPERRDREKPVKANKAKKTKRSQLTINLTNCKYDSVRRVARRFGLRPVSDEEEWTVFWTDTSVMLERVMDMRRYQKINHFPGMIEICRKDLLAKNMNRMLKLFPKEYNIFPRTWCLPADYGEFQAYCRAKKNKTFISKPESGSQGKGIFVFKNPKEIKPGEHMVCQHYISKPFTIDGFKFDFRIYVLVTSCDPLRVYVYKDGLGRFATVQYREPAAGNLGDVCLHLTNYAINKHSKDFVRDDDCGSKRRITTVNRWFQENGYDLQKIWSDIEDVIIKTLIAAHPVVKHNYRSCFPNHSRGSACFEILGFDVMLDRKLKPWLIEVNLSPSFHTDAPLDKEVKEGLLADTFNLIDLFINDKRRCVEEDRRRVKERLLGQKPKDSQDTDEARLKYEAHFDKHERSNMGGFRRIYPTGNEAMYSKFFDQSTSLCAETAASRARAELSKQQREEIESKQKELEHFRKRLGPPPPPEAQCKELRAESPRVERKSSAGVPSLRRASFRLPAQPQRQQKKPTLQEEGIVPYGEGVAPLCICDKEELERLAGLQLRDNLVRGLGVSEQLQVALNRREGEEEEESMTRPCSTAPAKPLFFTHTVYGECGAAVPPSHSSNRSNSFNFDALDGTPLHSLPGTVLPPNTLRHHTFSSGPTGRTVNKPQARSIGYRGSLRSSRPMAASALSPPSSLVKNHSQQTVPSLSLSPDVFGLSVTSAPIRLASHRHGPLPLRPPGQVRYQPGLLNMQHFALSQKLRNLQQMAPSRHV